jgi:hypothetical protein
MKRRRRLDLKPRERQSNSAYLKAYHAVREARRNA